MAKTRYSVLEICAGAGGQALGLEQAGFDTAAAVEIDKDACQTLRHNRPSWDVVEADLKQFDAKKFKGVDLFAGGVPCPPFSMAGKQLGAEDERDLFPTALRLINECEPRAVLLENVRGLSSPRFEEYRAQIVSTLISYGYEPFWELVYSSHFSVPQLRPRFILIAVQKSIADYFSFPKALEEKATVADKIYDLIATNGWQGAKRWKKRANEIAPTIVGGSKKHGGADLGPTRAKAQWAELGVDGKGIADAPPHKDLPIDFMPRLTLRMVARIQGFPDEWEFQGSKTSQYRQIGNALPPPVAKALGKSIINALSQQEREYESKEQMKIKFGT